MTSPSLENKTPPAPDPASVTSLPAAINPLDDSDRASLVRTEARAKGQYGPFPGPSPLSAELDQFAAKLLPMTDEQRASREARLQKEREAEERAERSRRASNWNGLAAQIGARYADCRLESFEFSPEPEYAARQRRVVDAIRAYGRDLETNVRAGVGIVLFGPAGTGKDHLLVPLMRQACRLGLTVRFMYGLNFFGMLRDSIDARDSTEAEFLRDFETPDVLVMSDPLPPFGDLTGFQASNLLRIVHARYVQRKPCWFTMNVADGQEAENRMSTQLVDRLRDGAIAAFCNWPSHRQAREVIE